jgi:probable phosphoglycerate mutase
MSVRLILVRHGETHWNKANKLQGKIEILLNKNGIRQVRKTAVKIKKSGEKPTIIIASPLARAMQSASIISNMLGIPFTINKNLSERDFGGLEGLTWKEINKLYGPNFKEIDRKQQYDYRPYGGESAEEVRKRILNFLEHVKKEYEGKTILVVTHAGVLRYLSIMLHKLGMDFEHSMEPGAYCIVEL